MLHQCGDKRGKNENAIVTGHNLMRHPLWHNTADTGSIFGDASAQFAPCAAGNHRVKLPVVRVVVGFKHTSGFNADKMDTETSLCMT